MPGINTIRRFVMNYFQEITGNIIRLKDGSGSSAVFNAYRYFDENAEEGREAGLSLIAAFLISLAGESRPLFQKARDYINRLAANPEWGVISLFFKRGADLILEEIASRSEQDNDFRDNLKSLAGWLTEKSEINNGRELAEKMWSVFFPEAQGLYGEHETKIEKLRKKRTVVIDRLNESPVNDPARDILFTSNVLLTMPQKSGDLECLDISDTLKEALKKMSDEKQVYWYDHPVQIGVRPENNEVLYGLSGLDRAVDFEKGRGIAPPDARPGCLLSVSVTHDGLHHVAKQYLEEEFKRSGGFRNIDVYIFTEDDTRAIIEEVLAPAAGHYLNVNRAEDALNVLGVDGEYGRHYSFLKAISALWQVFIDPSVKATFKIDLDQVFPEEELVSETGASAFEHLMTPLWGAEGIDSSGRPVKLGMIAGALVNQQDIGRSLFTPDVPFPEKDTAYDEYFFFSALPQSVSTEAEMMTRYGDKAPDGRHACIQRIHVTGGTVGILVDSLMKFRPFTPSFIGRAEDQAYIFSVMNRDGPGLVYSHKDGLIMRHDKEAFARTAIEAAHTGKLIGDYVRILYFTEYARALTDDISVIKDIADPFTGCFISRIPLTVVYLRFALKAASLLFEEEAEKGIEFLKAGSERIGRAIEFTRGKESRLKKKYVEERRGWHLFYDILARVMDALKGGDDFALALKGRAKEIIDKCRAGY